MIDAEMVLANFCKNLVFEVNNDFVFSYFNFEFFSEGNFEKAFSH